MKRKQLSWKKGVAAAIASAMVLTSMPTAAIASTVSPDQETDFEVLEEIDEQEADNLAEKTVVTEVENENRNPEDTLQQDETDIQNAQTESDAESVGNTSSEALEDNGGITNHGAAEKNDYDGGTMLEVTAGWNDQNGGHAEINDADNKFARESFTLLADVKVTDTDSQGDNPNKKAAFMIGNSDKSIRLLLNIGKLGFGGNSGGISANHADLNKTTTVGKWSSVALVYQENTEAGLVSVFLDGEKVLDAQNIGFKLSEMSDLRAYAARSFKTSFLLNGVYDNICVYDTAIEETEVIEKTAARAEQKQEKAVWVGVSLTTDPIIDSIKLPETNEAGDTIIWKSANPEILSDGGRVVKRPETNTQVNMEASVGEHKREFPVTIMGDSGMLEEDYDALSLINADDVRGNLSLVKKGKNGSVIEWTSGNTDVITDSADAGSLYDGGIVTRPEAGENPVEVTLTAKLTLNGNEKTKTFNVTVQPKTANLDTDYSAGYLWTNFGVSGGYEKIFLGYSEDGLNWNKLNKDENGKAQPILSNDVEGSDLGVRDPHLIRSPEGDKYWILGTDLHAEGGGSGGSGWNQLSASQNLVVWESTDLVNWSEPSLVFAGFDTAGCIWAPEAVYDDTTGDYAVYWSARDYSKKDTDENALRVYVCRTRDFHTFSEPKVWLSEDQDSGKEVNIIDSTIVNDGDKFYRFSTSDWNTVVDSSSTLDTEDVLDVRVNATESTPNGSWKRIVTRSGSSAAGFSGIEGLTVYQLPDGKWCAMGDNSGYKAFVTDDLSSGKFTNVNASFDEKFRHGTVVRLSQQEEARILEAFGNEESNGNGEAEVDEPVLEYNFEQDADSTVMTDAAMGNESKDNGRLYGNAKVVYDEERKSNVLQLDGSNGTYGEIPQGFFDKRNTMTISMDVKSEKDSGNFFTFTYGKNNTAYDFLRIRGSEVRNAITTNSYGDEREVLGSGVSAGDWQKVVMVIDKTNMKLYLDGTLVDENKNTGILTSNLGTDLLAYLGKSMYSGDGYFKGSFDNIKVYNRALSDEEILDDVIATAALVKGAVIGTAPDRTTALDYRGTDNHTAITSMIDQEKKEITPYVRKNADLSKIPVNFSLISEQAEVHINGEEFTNGNELDLSQDVEVTVQIKDRTETYTLKKPVISNNPVLPGQYADPDIDYFDGKFWIYPTTDGYPSWSGTVFHAFSSEDMVSWEDEGIIMELANSNPGLNDKGVQIAASPWAVKGSAWAPTIEAKDGKYYFYYCGKDSNGTSAIGVAVADNPAGPFKDLGEPLVTVSMCKNVGVSMGQAIDPSIFTDDDGKSYILFGNGSAAIAQLNEDMMSIKEGTLKQIHGLTDFRESVIVTKVNGKYHWTWSCDDANSPNYHVNYGVSDQLTNDDGSASVALKKKNLLSKDESKGILGSAHQSVVHVKDGKGNDRYFMAYHRFYTPLDIFTSGDGLGKHRETCIDEIFFDNNGEMIITPTLEGVPAVDMEPENKPNPEPNPDPAPTPNPTPTPAPDDGIVDVTPDVEDKGDGNVEVTIPDVSTDKPDEEKNVTVELPKEELQNAIQNSKEKEVHINVTVPDSITNSENVNLNELLLPKEVLQAAKDGKKDITVNISDSRNNSYSWSFSGKDVDESKLADVNLKLETRNASEDQQINDTLHADESGIIIDFAHKGELPAEASVTIDAQALGFKSGDKVTLYYYNDENGKLESQGKAYKVDKDGKITVEVSHCSKYVLKKTTAIKVAKMTGVKTTVSATAVKVSWKKNPNATGYRVYRYNTSSKKYVKVADVKDTSYTDKGLKPAAAYRYAVRAYTTASKTYYSSYTGNLKVLTKPAAPSSVKAKRTSKVSTKTTAELSFKKVDRATTYRIYKYNKKTKKYTIAFRVVNNKLYQYNSKTKKYAKVNNVKAKGGVITCSLKNLNLKSEKSQKYVVKATVSKAGYTTQYSVNSKAVTIK